jgi:hypothetical protein
MTLCLSLLSEGFFRGLSFTLLIAGFPPVFIISPAKPDWKVVLQVNLFPCIRNQDFLRTFLLLTDWHLFRELLFPLLVGQISRKTFISPANQHLFPGYFHPTNHHSTN